jgi:hypothetical protein
MKVTVELSEEDLKVLKERQVFRMQWISAGMDKKEPFDLVVQKVVNAAEQSMQPTLGGRGGSARSRVRKSKVVLPAKSG